MKKTVFPSLFILFLFSCAAPKVEFNHPVHDFGKQKVNSTVTHTFRFYNRGKGTLRIKRIKAACSCTGTVLSKKTIKPGESGKIKVSLLVAAIPLRMVRTVKVYTNASKKKPIVLTVKATAVE